MNQQLNDYRSNETIVYLKQILSSNRTFDKELRHSSWNKTEKLFEHPTNRIFIWNYLKTGKISNIDQSLISFSKYSLKSDKRFFFYNVNEKITNLSNYKSEEIRKKYDEILQLNKNFRLLFNVNRYFFITKAVDYSHINNNYKGSGLFIINSGWSQQRLIKEAINNSIEQIIYFLKTRLSFKNNAYAPSFFSSKLLSYERLTTEFFSKVLFLSFWFNLSNQMRKKIKNSNYRSDFVITNTIKKKVSDSWFQLLNFNTETSNYLFEQFSGFVNKRIIKKQTNNIQKQNNSLQRKFTSRILSNVDKADIVLSLNNLKSTRIILRKKQFKQFIPKLFGFLSYTCSPTFYELSDKKDFLGNKPLRPIKKKSSKISDEFFFIYLSANINLAKKIFALDYNNKAGSYFKYPKCCISFFKENWERCLKSHEGDLFAYMINSRFKFGSTVKINYFCNSALSYFDSGFCTHFSCSPNCKKTNQKISKYYEFLKRNNAFLFKKLDKLKNTKLIYHKKLKWFYLYKDKNNVIKSIGLNCEELIGWNLKKLYESNSISKNFIKIEHL